MNDRIRELANQADQYANQQNELYGVDFKTEYDQKFTELIILECGVPLSPMLRDMISRGQAFDLIKQHFGVDSQ